MSGCRSFWVLLCLFHVANPQVWIDSIQSSCNANSGGNENLVTITGAQNSCGIGMTVQIDIQIRFASNSSNMDISAQNCSINSNPINPGVYNATTKTMKLTYVIPDMSTTTLPGATSFACPLLETFNKSNVLYIIQVQLDIGVDAQRPSIISVKAINFPPEASNYENPMGIDSQFQIQFTPSEPIIGSCSFNGHHPLLSIDSTNIVTYIIQDTDGQILPKQLKYDCTISDPVGNAAIVTGFVQNSPMIDGRSPNISTVVNIFASDVPAKIGTIITITLRTQDLKRGLNGSCDINSQINIPLVESTDTIGAYIAQYRVTENDPDLQINAKLPIHCSIENQAGNAVLFQSSPILPFMIDANAPKVVSTAILFSSDDPAHEGTVIEVQISTTSSTTIDDQLSVYQQQCQINNVTVANSFTKSGKNTFLLTYVVGKNEAMWKPGKLSIHCVLQDNAANFITIEEFTDNNKLFARELKPVEFDPSTLSAYIPDKFVLISFIIVSIASHSISKCCPLIGLPRITGYLLTGILAGPYVLQLITASDIMKMRFVDEIALAYIGLAAGSKLHWSEMRRKMKSIMLVTLCLTIFEYVVGTLTIILFANNLSFLQSTTSSEKYVIAMLAGCMMIARSPSSTLAVIEETASQGHFTVFIFTVTVMCDIIVIVLFNVNNMITEAFLSDQQLSTNSILFLLAEISISVVCGIVSGKLLSYIILYRTASFKRKSYMYVIIQCSKSFLLLAYGFSIFLIGHFTKSYLEPLMCCMVAGATIWNWSQDPEELGILLKKLADLVYVGFFTLTGASLELDMLVKAIAVSVVLCLTRIFAIFLGAYIGGTLAKENKVHNKVSWMAYITQAGVTLGLAKKIQLLYPGWGSYFATMIVAVVICNQIIGPPLLRMVLRIVGDAKPKEGGKVDGLKSLIIGDDDKFTQINSAKLRMKNCGWEPFSFCMSTKDTKDDNEMHHQLQSALKAHEPVNVVVVMMSSDALNYQVIQVLASICNDLKRISVLRIVVNVVGDPRENGEENSWSTTFATMPMTEQHGDAIDVVVVDRNEATDMLIELAACGKLINQMDSYGFSPRTNSDPKLTKIKYIPNKMRQMMWV